MTDRAHPSAKPAGKTLCVAGTLQSYAYSGRLNLGNLPPKQQGFGATQFPRTPSRVDPKCVLADASITLTRAQQPALVRL